MNSSIYKRQSILLGTTVICAVFALISITWAAFSSTLNVSGKATVSAQSWDIDFTNTVNTKWTTAQSLTGTKSNLAELPATSDTTAFSLPKDQEASGFLGTLKMSGDKITYTWYVQNFGTFDATYSLNGVIATSTYASGSNVDITCNTSDNSTDKTFCNNYVKTLVTIDGVTATPTSTFTLAKAGETGDHATVVLTIEITGENQIYTGTLANMNQNTNRVQMLSNNITMLSSSNGDLDISVKSLSIASTQEVGTTKSTTKEATTTTTTTTTTSYCSTNLNKSQEFTYSGKEVTYTAECAGKYKLEVWGAEGGYVSTSYIAGYGGYSVGEVTLKADDILYINVGGQGNYSTSTTAGYVSGGYNGGGNSYTIASGCNNSAGSGGGATSIATKSGLLSTLSSSTSSILIVAAGGGGAEYRYCNSGDYNYSSGGSGGGYKGNSSYVNATTWSYTVATGGTQTSGGTAGNHNGETGATDGSFGLGGSSTRTGGYTNAGGGGGGFYGGAGGMFLGGAGGSSYIGNSLLSNKAMYCYNCTESSETSIKTIKVTCKSSDPTINCAKTGAGYARVTYLG